MAPGALGANPPVILVLGDSLSAAFGIDPRAGWVTLLQARLQREGYAFRVVNSSISGDTTFGASARLPHVIEQYHPAIVIVEIGGNDGLRGLPLAEVRRNLVSIVDTAQKRGAQVLLVGMRLPPNYGMGYTQKFHAVYAEVAKAHGVALVPFFLDGVAGNAALMQADGIHPRAEAQARLVENVWPGLKPLLR